MQFCKNEVEVPLYTMPDGKTVILSLRCQVTGKPCPVGSGDQCPEDQWLPVDSQRDYCTQNDNDCSSCSLGNYHRDCQNKLI